MTITSAGQLDAFLRAVADRRAVVGIIGLGNAAPRHVMAIGESGGNLAFAHDADDSAGIIGRQFPGAALFAEFEQNESCVERNAEFEDAPAASGPALSIGRIRRAGERLDGVFVGAQYTLRAKDSTMRAGVMDALKSAGIPATIYYPRPLHRQTAFAEFPADPAGLEQSAAAAKTVFSLPMHPYLTLTDQDRIIGVLQQAC